MDREIGRQDQNSPISIRRKGREWEVEKVKSGGRSGRYPAPPFLKDCVRLDLVKMELSLQAAEKHGLEHRSRRVRNALFS